MDFNKKIVAVLLFGCATMSAANAADSGTLSFNGTLLASGCSVAASSVNVPVNLGNLSTQIINALPFGETSSALTKQARIVLNTCPAGTASVAITGIAAPTNEDVYVAVSGNKVGVLVSNASGVKLNNTTPDAVTLVAGTNELVYNVGLTHLTSDINPNANYNMSLNYAITYN